MQIEFFKNGKSDIELEYLKNEVNGFINDLREDGIKCLDIQFIFDEDEIIVFVKYEGLIDD
ncbi:TPA: hypothetical protein VDG30_001331 [Streptococcus pyogenes]|uniref:Sporulation protein Cse60 n=2 Tax=Streptococcus dysgalactiae TaxID=1334 RepID=A0A9X8XI85_STREQ|nr:MULTISPECIES: hypothetical protein [Streptococcus]EGL47172.1 hypothetical protein HMPREF9964_0231 [Streptococcus dysgalactiae subsp. equisimilis SK1249]QBX14257.1 hypothetical protein Javan131_0042 [Streptococcus phage Javan131]QBX14833.1 hypothetical protein Javan157_0039 [Streptococcus phage Javan157]QBX14936.1 hypothetical protein Javan161_0045 [Streptococcus phage Javan161]QBX23960.1 hypothetical protein Javan170_0019 [Streptococcus phage Javan170]QBX28800.1 hypothetical protein Javan4